MQNWQNYLKAKNCAIVEMLGFERASLFLFLTEEAYSHGGLRTRELGQTPLC